MENEFEGFQKRVINLYIPHPGVKHIWGLFDTRRKFRKLGQGVQNKETPLNLFVMGQSRVGKSLMAKKYAESVERYEETKPNGTKIDIIPVAYMDLPAPFSKAGLYNQIIDKALNAPTLGNYAKVDQLKRRAFTLLKEQKVEMLIVDELDYLLTSSFVGKKEAMELIKNITNEAGVILVCMGTDAIEELRKTSLQIIGRFPPVVLEKFKECDDSFLELLKNIEEDLNSPVSLGFSDVNSAMPKALHYLCGGLVGWLKPIITEAFDIIGVFDDDFNDFSILRKIDGNVLKAARRNVIGELSNNEIIKFLEGEEGNDTK